jgi:septal ring factor EnvC (AmiA/AmiB activator)
MGRMSVETLQASRTELEAALGELTRTHSEMEATLAATVAGSDKLAEEISRSVVALQFQDSVGQRLTHVADELAEMRTNVHLPLEYLSRETPVLGETRRKQVGARLEARYTMAAERKPSQNKTTDQNEMDGVELF